MRRLLVASALGVLMSSTASFAGDQSAVYSAEPSGAMALPQIDVSAAPTMATRSFEQKRPLALPALYGATAFLQGYDAYSTLTVIRHGGTEANPLMRNVTKSPAAFIGLKAGVAIASIMAAERMWKSRNRVGAIATMVVANGLMATVAANNARVLSRVR